jgi:hypothetical protein
MSTILVRKAARLWECKRGRELPLRERLFAKRHRLLIRARDRRARDRVPIPLFAAVDWVDYHTIVCLGMPFAPSARAVEGVALCARPLGLDLRAKGRLDR